MNLLLLSLIMVIDVTKPPYSAIPDGKTDCTKAIQAAADAADIKAVATSTGYVIAQTAPTLYFPSGVYVISAPIKFRPVCQIKGETAIIVQTGNCPAFTFIGGTLIDINSMKFTGGTNAIYINNPNVNCSIFNLTFCYFDMTRKAAVMTESTGVGPSTGILSAELNLTECRFRDCYQMLDECCDMASIRNCWAQMSLAPALPIPADAGFLPFIVVRRGRLSITDTILVPADFVYTANTPPIKHYWIHAIGSVSATRTVFSGENGGIPIMMFGPSIPDPNNQNGPRLCFDKCQLSAGPTFVPTGSKTPNPTSAILTLNGMPSLLTMENNTHLFVAPMVLDPSGNGATAAAAMKITPQIFIGKNVNFPATIRIPSTLTKYIVK